ncbi:hypothetical protein HETIRDRAFT_109123 [Heterobasidion irregulare TC 32-1]|uniref:Uncharacterized protein n=1 Tax=Heterobasidion irregulare (strain TC 32-1) TaxID=747525 RepID=W4KC33_HETIT|nr:uncharacterized protein HETIRDRAFT_109123 [Heterobasidion irregulare TC 32-1]ETW83432.1 hypothetical protein HETIRDRAFT_109123 [Heterobasidion irregulare TC 32-1]
MAASGNPDLLALDITTSSGPKPASLPLESHRSLLTFSDYLAPWFSIDGKDFVPPRELPFEQFGSLSDAVLSRLQEALIEARSMSEDLGIKLVSSATTPEEELAGARDYKYQRGRADCLFVAYQRLPSVPMTSFDALLWFREFQRVLLDMRAWVIYKQEIQSRLFDPDFDSPTPVLPLRSVITKHFSVVNRLIRCGIPVWWIRERETLTTDTLIRVLISRAALGAGALAQHFQPKEHTCTIAWVQPYELAYLPTDKIGNRRGEVPSSKAPGCSALAAVNHTEQVHYTLKQIIAVSTELYGVDFSNLDSDMVLMQSMQSMGFDMAKITDLLNSVQFQHHPPLGKALLVMPSNRFSVHAPAHLMIFMKTKDWRVALEGRYHMVNFDHCSVKPLSSLADIIRLPVAPPPNKKARIGNDPNVPKAQRNPNMKAQRHIIECVDINVRFFVYGGFKPYDSAQSYRRGSLVVDREKADTDKGLWAEVIWELSLMNFRLKLLELDRELLKSIYEDSNVKAAHREWRIFQIWGGGGVQPMWEKHGNCDLFSSRDWQVRRWAVESVATALRDWPGGTFASRWDECCFDDRDTYLKFEHDIFSFYIATYRHRHGRLPTIPVIQPKSMISLHGQRQGEYKKGSLGHVAVRQPSQIYDSPTVVRRRLALLL